MNLKILFIYWCVWLALTACNKQKHTDYEITKIEVATGGCFGPCQYTAMSVDSAFNYKYYGGTVISRTNRPEDKFKIEGYYIGKISKGLWDTINVKLRQIQYDQLNTSYEIPNPLILNSAKHFPSNNPYRYVQFRKHVCNL